VLGTFLLILPFGFAGALSPMMLTEQTLVLATAGGRSAANRYAAAAMLVLFLFTAGLVFFGRAISLPAEPSLSATLDIVLGAGLIAIAGLLHYRGTHLRRRRPHRTSATRSFGAGGAFGFGAFSMATNFTTLALMIPAAKVIAAAGTGLPGRTVLVAVLVVLASAPAWVPVALTRVAPGPAERGLSAVGNLIGHHGRLLIVFALAVLGLFLLIRGIAGVV
jgi:hypothetical protein